MIKVSVNRPKNLNYKINTSTIDDLNNFDEPLVNLTVTMQILLLLVWVLMPFLMVIAMCSFHIYVSENRDSYSDLR